MRKRDVREDGVGVMDDGLNHIHKKIPLGQIVLVSLDISLQKPIKIELCDYIFSGAQVRKMFLCPECR